jgi:hypothetical protein
MTLAIVVIAHERRMNTTFPRVMQSVLDERPDEVVAVADFHNAGPWRHLMIPAFTRTTIDALVKRDVGWAATTTDTVMYLSDDHCLHPGFVKAFQDYEEDESWDIIAPTRFCRPPAALPLPVPKQKAKKGQRKKKEPVQQGVRLNMGEATRYVAGHGGLYRRRIAKILPWTATIPHANWDVIHTHHLIANGAKLIYAKDDLMIEDIEGGEPWK